MGDIIISSIIALAGTLIGTFSGIVVSAKLTTFRIEQLEKKVDKHNQLVERMTVVETRLEDLSKK